ncbi:DUF4070 domain-containing protein [Bacteroidota bacterium]
MYDEFIKLIADIYQPEKSLQRLIRFLSTYKSPKTRMKVPANYGFKEIKMLFRVLYLLGIKDGNRKFFWKLILWTLLNKSKHLDQAIFYSIMIYQMNQTYLTIEQSVKDQNKNI